MVHLLRLQRNKLYYQTFDNLEIKAARKMSPKQTENLAKARAALSGGRGSGGEKNRKQKQHIPQAQRIDQKPNVQNLNNVKDANVKKIVALSSKVSQLPSVDEQIKEGDPTSQAELDDLFRVSDTQLDEEKSSIMELIEARRNEQVEDVEETDEFVDPIDVEEEESEAEQNERRELMDESVTKEDIRNIINTEVQKSGGIGKITNNRSTKKSKLIDLLFKNRLLQGQSQPSPSPPVKRRKRKKRDKPTVVVKP